MLSSAKKKEVGVVLLTLVYNLSIWRAEPAVMKGENVLDVDGEVGLQIHIGSPEIS